MTTINDDSLFVIEWAYGYPTEINLMMGYELNGCKQINKGYILPATFKEYNPVSKRIRYLGGSIIEGQFRSINWIAQRFINQSQITFLTQDPTKIDSIWKKLQKARLIEAL